MGGSFQGKEQDATKGVYAQAGTYIHAVLYIHHVYYSIDFDLEMCMLYIATAADVFQLIEQPEHAKKKLDVCASYFEIYLGKVCATHTRTLTLSLSLTHSHTHTCTCTVAACL